MTKATVTKKKKIKTQSDRSDLSNVAADPHPGADLNKSDVESIRNLKIQLKRKETEVNGENQQVVDANQNVEDVSIQDAAVEFQQEAVEELSEGVEDVSEEVNRQDEEQSGEEEVLVTDAQMSAGLHDGEVNSTDAGDSVVSIFYLLTI